MKTRGNWRVTFKHRPRRSLGNTVLRLLAGMALLSVTAGATYAIYLMHTLASDMRQLATKLDSLEAVAADMHSLTGHVALIDEANQRVTKMERYMTYIPKLADTGDRALAQSMEMNAKMDLTNEKLNTTDQCLRSTMESLTGVTDGLQGMPAELRHSRLAIEKMAMQFPAPGEVQEFLAKAGSSLDTTSEGIARVSTDFDEMRSLLQGMSDQFGVLPEMKGSLDQTGATINAAIASLSPLAQEIPRFTTTLEDMTRTTNEMNRTTQEMAQSMKKLPRQGTVSIGVLTAAQLLSR